MQKAILTLIGCLCAVSLHAIPAKRERCTLTLTNGKTIEATWMGDETTHFYLADDGRCLQCDSDGIAHFVEADSIRNRWKARALKRQKAFNRKNVMRRRETKDVTMSGSKRGLVILVQFPQTPFYLTQSNFDHLLNEVGYFDDINIGSVHDYFYDNSYGQFNFLFDVVGPVTMDQPLSYYGKNNSYGDDSHPATMVREAIQKVDDIVDFKHYDWNNDGEVEQVFIFHSGYDEAQSHQKSDIWSHAWTLSEALEEGDGEGPVSVDGVIVDRYATGAELRGSSGYQITGIGTACHEFSHCFGIPDFYDVDGKNFGMNSWDIMDYGSYNGNGGAPAGFTSYERYFCGWLEPIELIDPVEVYDMPPLTSEPVAYILRNSGKEDEYFLFENRQKVDWDRSLGGHGLLVVHVDYDDSAWEMNTVNVNRSHQRMTIVPADNILYSSTLAGDPWPGTTGQTMISDIITPKAQFYNLNAEGDLLMHHVIAQISETSDGLINFIFDEEALGINSSLENERQQSHIYDLSGKMVDGKWFNDKWQKGIFIKEGKKTLIR